MHKGRCRGNRAVWMAVADRVSYQGDVTTGTTLFRMGWQRCTLDVEASYHQIRRSSRLAPVVMRRMAIQ